MDFGLRKFQFFEPVFSTRYKGPLARPFDLEKLVWRVLQRYQKGAAPSMLAYTLLDRTDIGATFELCRRHCCFGSTAVSTESMARYPPAAHKLICSGCCQEGSGICMVSPALLQHEPRPNIAA